MVATNYDRVRIPTLPNVVKDIRLSVDMKQRELADEAGVSTLAVLRAEQYLYNEIPSGLSDALARIDGERTPSQIDEAYVKGRKMQLKVNSDAITTNPYFRSRVRAGLDYATDHFQTVDQAALVDDNSHHPFVLFRTYLFAAFDLPTSQIQFCLFTGANPAVVAKFENYDSNFPESLKETLSFVLDMRPDEIATLELIVKRAHD